MHHLITTSIMDTEIQVFHLKENLKINRKIIQMAFYLLKNTRLVIRFLMELCKNKKVILKEKKDEVEEEEEEEK